MQFVQSTDEMILSGTTKVPLLYQAWFRCLKTGMEHNKGLTRSNSCMHPISTYAPWHFHLEQQALNAHYVAPTCKLQGNAACTANVRAGNDKDQSNEVGQHLAERVFMLMPWISTRYQSLSSGQKSCMYTSRSPERDAIATSNFNKPRLRLLMCIQCMDADIHKPSGQLSRQETI